MKVGTKWLAPREFRLTGNGYQVNVIRQISNQINFFSSLSSCAGFATVFWTTEFIPESIGRHTSCVVLGRPSRKEMFKLKPSKNVLCSVLETEKAWSSLTWTLWKSKIVVTWKGGKSTKSFPIVYHFNIRKRREVVHRSNIVIFEGHQLVWRIEMFTLIFSSQWIYEMPNRT